MSSSDDLERDVEVARRVLTEVEYGTWIMAKAGFSRTAIALYRRKSKGTINACLKEAARKIEQATDGDG